MAIKSIKLKFYFGRNSQDHQTIWHTHEIVNHGVAYYLQQLLLLRQQPVGNVIDSKSSLLRDARTTQAANGRSSVGTDEEILAVLRQLYEEIVPAATGKKSNAQILSRAFLSPLVDPKSIAGLGVAKKRKNDTAAEGNSVLITAKSKYGLLPLFRSYSDSIENWEKRSVCTTWDRDMFQQAIERLCSWESWNRRITAERLKLTDKVKKLINAGLDPLPDWAQRLRIFEAERKLELNAVALPSDNMYRILKSGVRGWRDLRTVWLDEPNKSKEILMEHMSDLQRELRGDFGDPAVFTFLARPENHFIWDNPADNISRYLELNEATEKLARSKSEAQFTFADPIKHPVWVRLDGPGGNLQWYHLTKNGKETLATLLLLEKQKDKIVEKQVSVAIAHSLQWKNIQISDYAAIPVQLAASIDKQKNDTKVQWVEWIDKGTKNKFWGKLGGAKIQFERADLEKSRYYYDTYINIAINFIPVVRDELYKSFVQVKPDETSPWTVVDIKPEIFEQQRWLGKQVNGIAGISEGLRVMSVSMRFKTLAICSIYQIAREPSNMSVPIAGTSWHAQHKSSFILSLTGEKETQDIAKKRQKIVEERLKIKRKIRILSRLLSLASKQGDDREEYIKIFKKIDFVDETILLDQITAKVCAAQEEWQDHIVRLHRELEQELGKEIEAWRKKYRRKSSELRNICGLSLWWIQELTETRKVINSWSAHARYPREIVRARATRVNRKDKKAREVDLDTRLLRHINHVKEDRIKKGADTVVMHALGYRYNPRRMRWTAQHPPCRIILFHDIRDFRMDRAHSKRSNTRLMAWAHRALPKHVASQAEIYGVLTGSVKANNIYQWHARQGTPAVRMMQVKEEHMDATWFLHGLLSELTKRKQISKKEKKAILNSSRTERQKKVKELVSAGQWIPWEQGQALVTYTNQVVVGNATINTSQMLQRFFWERQLSITKLWCVGSNETAWLPIHVGKRIETVLGFGKLVLSTDGYDWVSITKREYNKCLGKPEEEETDEMQEIQEISGEDTASKNKRMFFRDPTGTYFPKEKWYGLEIFWRGVEKKLDSALNPSNMQEARDERNEAQETRKRIN